MFCEEGIFFFFFFYINDVNIFFADRLSTTQPCGYIGSMHISCLRLNNRLLQNHSESFLFLMHK